MFLAQFLDFFTCHKSATEFRTVVWGCPWFDGRLNCDRNAFSSRYESAIEFDDDTDCAPLNTTPPTIQKRSAFHLRAISVSALLVSPVLLRPEPQNRMICISIILHGDVIGRRIGASFSYQSASSRVTDVSECFDNVESTHQRGSTSSHNPCFTVGSVRLIGYLITFHHHDVWYLVLRSSGNNSQH